MNNNFRAIAVESLKKIFLDGSFTNITISKDSQHVDLAHRNLYRKSVLGVTENLYFIDYVINKFSKIRTKKLKDNVLMILRLAVYQFYFLDNKREDIIVNESVEYIKEKEHIKLSNYVNAVLRNILRNKQLPYLEIEKLNKLDKLSVLYSYPVWIINEWTRQFGQDNIEEILKKNNEQAPLSIRVNTLKITKSELKEILRQKEIICEDCKIADKGIIIKNITDIDNFKEYIDGLFSIQSESSMLVNQILNPRKNSKLIDLCAAPGSKSMDAAERLENTGKILSCDLYEHKIKLINSDVKRLNLINIKSCVKDALKIDEGLLNEFDYCIVDVPCSGLGIIRRKPEIKFNRNKDDSASLFDIQYNILLNASNYLKPGGELVYSTCTTNIDENINVIRKFLKYNKNYNLVNIEKETKGYFNTAKDGYINIYPHTHDMDGFFIAKIKKNMI